MVRDESKKNENNLVASFVCLMQCGVEQDERKTEFCRALCSRINAIFIHASRVPSRVLLIARRANISSVIVTLNKLASSALSLAPKSSISCTSK